MAAILGILLDGLTNSLVHDDVVYRLIFTEGFDTGDLQDAKALHDELG